MLVGTPIAVAFGSHEVALGAIVIVGLFHLANVVFMGISTFLYAYATFLPNMWFLHLWVQELLYGAGRASSFVMTD